MARTPHRYQPTNNESPHSVVTQESGHGAAAAAAAAARHDSLRQGRYKRNNRAPLFLATNHLNWLLSWRRRRQCRQKEGKSELWLRIGAAPAYFLFPVGGFLLSAKIGSRLGEKGRASREKGKYCSWKSPHYLFSISSPWPIFPPMPRKQFSPSGHQGRP